ncbi:diguanylate cyclase domain-containing protein [Caloramator australicus]|uniref:Transcriptional regulator, AraC family n=1 Tax=Caloramator australicus RC3 TaxID=857293 RepID=I7KUA7_9CLOT|nr:diguanylate cyclase [Caloramator australicus]CCJ33468.1 transcriptional regulator, AraC family [Caloramator australicus RC3]
MVEKQVIERIQEAIDFIEEHLEDKIYVEDIAKIAFMSLSSFYSIFSLILGTTVKDYVRKRRLSLAAYFLVYTNLSILNIAVKFGYEGYEPFSRAFKKLFGVSPKKYREFRKYIDVFPKIQLKYGNSLGGENMVDKEMNKESVLQQIHNTSNGYILDVDIDKFEGINKIYGYDIGDKVLIEVPRRIKEVLEELNLPSQVIRISNDEFVVIVKHQPIEFIEMLSQKILDAMKPKFQFGDISFDVSVSIGITNFTISSADDEIINKVKDAMLLAKKEGRNRFKVI